MITEPDTHPGPRIRRPGPETQRSKDQRPIRSPKPTPPTAGPRGPMLGTINPRKAVSRIGIRAEPLAETRSDEHAAFFSRATGESQSVPPGNPVGTFRESQSEPPTIPAGAPGESQSEPPGIPVGPTRAVSRRPELAALGRRSSTESPTTDESRRGGRTRPSQRQAHFTCARRAGRRGHGL
jgi:hypothetical protein